MMKYYSKYLKISLLKSNAYYIWSTEVSSGAYK